MCDRLNVQSGPTIANGVILTIGESRPLVIGYSLVKYTVAFVISLKREPGKRWVSMDRLYIPKKKRATSEKYYMLKRVKFKRK